MRSTEPTGTYTTLPKIQRQSGRVRQPQLTGKKTTIILASGGDFRPGSPFEAYNQASGYLRQVLGFIGLTDLGIVMADRAHPRRG
ncbi:NAD(P)H-dependent oxidoreductase [Bordetella sp. FB-8]|uniref:NAD(P)H-dependent oxidoreductase n=1 Tax=Bordetella sp. FB-8 TaxID=1159870 RepID=UPI00039D9290